MINKSGDDANPLKNRLPAEVVSRRARPQKVVVNEDIVQVDLQTALALKPEKRLTWLTKACKMTAKSEASASDLFNIITTRRFASVPVKISKKLQDIVLDNFALFSEKQQRYLRSDEWALNILEKDDKEFAELEDAEHDNADELPKVRDGSRSDPARSNSRGDETSQTLSRRDVLADAFSAARTPPPVAQEEGGVWVSVPHNKNDEQQRHATVERDRRKAREREAQKAAMELEREAKEREQQEQRAKTRQNEADADQMLEMLFQPRRQSPPRQPSARTRDNRRGLSRSRSVSVKRRSPDRPKQRKISYEEALQQRLAAREKTDTTRGAVSHWRSRPNG